MREHFGSRFGFIMAAAGAAVGLGNIWGFPTQAASNGGGAFLVAYLMLVLVLAFPMLVMEVAIGRYGQANPVDSVRKLGRSRGQKAMASLVGYAGMLVPSLVLSFYAIVAGWLLAFLAAAVTRMLGWEAATGWLQGFGLSRNIVWTLVFYLLTILVVQAGVRKGIERWSARLMPALFVLFLVLFAYILTQNGAMEGLRHYLVPDFSKVLEPGLLISAMGQAFFSLTIGGCSMLMYGSYLSKQESIPGTAFQVTLIDTGVAFLAGLVILPAMFVAMNNGVTIFAEDGSLLSSDTLVFTVLPALFDTMGPVGLVMALVFFVLMGIAALTSSISMLEVPVSYTTERFKASRPLVTWLLGGGLALFSVVICLNFGALFGFVIRLSTQNLQPLVGLGFCLLGGWLWGRAKLFEELVQGSPELASSLFWRIWPWYVRLVCPLLVLLVIGASW
ncbi:sodium-dependent transporter [Zobellella denitrificans]|uniref:sodium-dependent transporter n=1 Tax=Zobellella denitrificans TaxID=347534 RepID=UPI000B8C13E5|nr:sodium-dependent transporter [Zobellella denitrificans]OXS15770.1 sodium-dependent transporter [Zobellella denitrificans]